MELGTLKEVTDLRSVWPHEALNFTPWVAENIDLLADTVGIDITVDETESDVGDFSVDIYASETGTDRKIIIENQLEDTDHDHLGKLITYASGKGADIVIWIVKHAREEHKAAIEWLNNHTDDTANNVDKTRTKDNIVFVNISQQEMYERLFSGAVSEYNARQKRNDRKITVSYYEHQFGRGYSPNVVTSADKRKSFYEDVVQIGDMKDTGVGTVDAETAKAVLTEYMNGFEQRNPNFKVFCAVLHMDEATPHLHIDYVPIGHYSRGIPVQNGIAQALSEMGFGVGKNAIARWRQSEYEVLKSICIRYDIELAPPKKSVGSKSVELYKEEKRLEEKIEKLREMELAADSTEVPYKKRLIGGGYILTEQEYAEFTAEKKAVSVQRVDAERKVMEAEKIVRQTESRRLVLSDREDAFEKTKASEEKKIQEKVKQTNLDLLDAIVAKEKAEELAAEQQDINEVLQKTKAELRKAEEEKHRYREYAFENAHLKREIAAYDQKHSEEVERLTADYSEKIKNLTEEIADKEKVISEQASGIAQLELEIKTKEEAIQKSEADVELWKSIYSDAYDVGEYACRKLGQDFERCLHMRNDNYRLSYIFGDERSR